MVQFEVVHPPAFNTNTHTSNINFPTGENNKLSVGETVFFDYILEKQQLKVISPDAVS